MARRIKILSAVCLIGLGSIGYAQDLARAPNARGQSRESLQQVEQNTQEMYGELLDYYANNFGLASDAAPEQAMSGMSYELVELAGAEPDECFTHIGSTDEPMQPPCPLETVEKTNQAYVWGLTQKRDKLWYGTAPNVHCLVMGGYLGSTNPIQTSSYVCEFGESYLAQTTQLPDVIGDFRPPRLFSYDLSVPEDAEPLVDITDRLTPQASIALSLTLGIRAAGAHRDVVLFAGPALLPPDSINMFAFKATTGEFLGYQNLPQWDNIRKFRMIKRQLYFGVGNSSANPDPGGSVVRWIGEPSVPFRFQVVGRIPSPVADFVGHEGRIAITTWPSVGPDAPDEGLFHPAGVYVSPLIPQGGLRGAHMDGWNEIWNAFDYEVDPVVALTYGGGAISSQGGKLTWGTMHVPGLAMSAHMAAYGPPSTPLEMALMLLGTWRAISIHRAELDPNGELVQTELLYGEGILPAYSIIDGWGLYPTSTGSARFGHSGMNNLFNNYTWTMGVFQERTVIGTMDCSYLVLGGLGDDTVMPPEFAFLGERLFGADLWAFTSTDGPAELMFGDGGTTPMSYGIRTMIPGPRQLFLGMANPMNLHEDGGWKLLSLRDLEIP